MDAQATSAGVMDAAPVEGRAPSHLGVRLLDDGASVAVYSRHADAIFFCLFDEAGERETQRWRLSVRDGDVFHGFVPGVKAGARYGLRADGPWEPARGHRFDPAKLLIDPYATRLDRVVAWSPELSLPRERAQDTARFMPRAVVEEAPAPASRLAGSRRAPRLIYELPVRAFTMLRDDVPQELRGTLGGLTQPQMIDHLVRLGVSHVELMPVTAWMDEPHLVKLGLSNAWGYNPASFMALDPRLAPGGMADLRAAVGKLHAAGIAVLLDVVFNHTAESDLEGPTLSLRGLDNATYYLHQTDAPGALVNDTGCGNTFACNRPAGVRLVMDSMRRFVEGAGIDGFRFDLAPVLGRSETGFSAQAPLLSAIAQDPVLRDVMLIAEPWDIGPGGYQLGGFPAPFMEWNDRYRDDVRRFWRGEFGAIGAFATRLAGSRDVFGRSHRPPSASVNFTAAHDGLALRDVVTYSHKRNEANGEENRDGSSVNHSWNHGDRRSRGRGDRAGARPRCARASGDDHPVAGRAHDHGGRRVRPHAEGQQQRLLPGQRDHLARLGEHGRRSRQPSPLRSWRCGGGSRSCATTRRWRARRARARIIRTRSGCALMAAPSRCPTGWTAIVSSCSRRRNGAATRSARSSHSTALSSRAP